MKKFIRDGKVGVVISLGYGAGWSTCNYNFKDELCMDCNIVEAVLNDDLEKVKDYVEKTYPDADTDGYNQLSVEWIPEGVTFQINDDCGSETLSIIDPRSCMVA